MQPEITNRLHDAQDAAWAEIEKMGALLARLAEKRRCLAGECGDVCAWCAAVGDEMQAQAFEQAAELKVIG